jgi:prevent-host-death family protein
MKTVSIAQAKDSLTELLYEAEEGRPIQVTRRGKAVAVLLSEADYARLRALAPAPDFGAWAQQWRSRLPAGFDGITPAELTRWADL